METALEETHLNESRVPFEVMYFGKIFQSLGLVTAKELSNMVFADGIADFVMDGIHTLIPSGGFS